MPWSRKLSAPIALNDGRTIATLSDAARLVLALPELHGRNPHWQYAGELLIRAAGDKKAVESAEVQLRIALIAEGLI